MATQRCCQEELERERTPSELRSWLDKKVEQICTTKEGLEDFRLQNACSGESDVHLAPKC